MADGASANTKVIVALRKLTDVALSETGQSVHASNFLAAWWSGDRWNQFTIADLLRMETKIARDMATILFLAHHPGNAQAAHFGYRDIMSDLIDKWRTLHRG
jgi:hypothetical protein